MGYRTVVMLSNDMYHDWSNDHNLGQKIAMAISANQSGRNTGKTFAYGSVVEVVHSNTKTLAVLEGYNNFVSLTCRDSSNLENTALKLLKDAADIHGYRLIKKSTKKEIQNEDIF